MVWLFLSLFSALFLGIYDVLKKHALRDNAVWLVLLFSTFSSGIIFIVLLGLSMINVLEASEIIYVPPIALNEHLLILLKTILVLSSWIFSYFALKYLPLTIFAPIRATSPVWTIVGALVIYQEQLSVLQWLGVSLTFIFFYLFSTTGSKEGISFKNNKWVWFAIIGTLFGAGSGLFDKFLIKEVDRMAVQAWFSIYQVVLLSPLVFVIRRTIKNPLPLIWRWSIPLIGFFLVIADFLYFYALDFEDSLISVIALIRRGSVLFSFIFGALLFKEKNIKSKAVFLAGIILGIIILLLG